MHACLERADMLAGRVENLVRLRRTARATRKVAIVLFNFPPNAGNTGTAAYLSVFASLQPDAHLDEARGLPGRRSRPPSTNCARRSSRATANGSARTPMCMRASRWTNMCGASVGCRRSRGNGARLPESSRATVLRSSCSARGSAMSFVGIQPAFGYEGDPMRLLFEKGFAPTHAFSAFYSYLREDFAADAVLHFGTHGSLGFMPGKQSGLSAKDWPDRLIGDLPNIYLYAANNPSEGAIAKRRAAATLISYLTPPVAHAGLYRGLLDLKSTLERWRSNRSRLRIRTRRCRATDPVAGGSRRPCIIGARHGASTRSRISPAWRGRSSNWNTR